MAKLCCTWCQELDVPTMQRNGILPWPRDLKPHNLLMDPKTMRLKIADLGLARAFTLPMKKYTHEVKKTA
ncbi:hypothetical protein HA466_0162690 [Hirschfeldia incana]|nr:hypothetical protein HA466_0162690 [Hirschfeldia incana]